MFRKIGRRKLVPYYDRAEIEDGAIDGRGLEICWLKDQTDLLFAQIQGSARVSLEDGSTVRINYDAHNGYPYTPVGRILIERGIIPKEQMSMQKIREWMEQNPDGAKELRRQNRSYVFFREVQLSDKDEAVGAQGVPLTPGRSIAVDKSLHVYGTPFFIEGELPIESERSKTPFRRLMIAQDTGSAIVGPARADLYFGAGADAGKVAGRLRHNMRFVMLVPKSLDPVARGRKMPVPDARPSETDRKTVSAGRSAEGSAKGPEDRRETARGPGAAASGPRHAAFDRPGRHRKAGAAAGSPAQDRGGSEKPRRRHLRRISPPSMKRRSSNSIPEMTPLAAAQARPQRGRARALGERRQAGQAAAQAASRREAAGRSPEAETSVAPRPAASPKPPATPRIAAPQPRPEPPPLAPIGRRERSQLSRGRKEIDARLDLHGMTQTRAHRVLLELPAARPS